ncbi:MAG: hypothetical protein LBH10_06440 [Burkholderiaceae bacterium]|jgi:hypothetical protein|nr:hypothetical protein [Burkholderiaceae bacterium]
MKYSPSTGCFYLDNRACAHLPDDVIVVPDDQARAAMNARAAGSTLEVIDGALTITAPNAQQTLQTARARAAQRVRESAARAIKSGYVSVALGDARTYPSTPDDQSNLLSAHAAQTAALWCMDGSGAWDFAAHTPEQTAQALADWTAHLQTLQLKHAALQARIAAAQSPQELDGITW